ncbi:nuclear transport factor 2 family protein [Serratia sp. DD3]|uniref:nuclear transport factor 2 family protein n=1 Tax=Serratia sp. DD3 TaxID=1410619 RepID=UPI0003C515F3|nr:nuclear transport factor 2 family protein [Serratia sp. DD3]KEY59743.1 snoaL-like domain protein [Serratia sp. DD3]
MTTTPSVISKCLDFYSELNSEKIALLPLIYHPQIELVDPLGQHTGIAAVEAYFRSLLTRTAHCRFSIDTYFSQDQQTCLNWIMSYSHPKLEKGRTLELEGCSILRVQDDKIIWQRDYYDMGAMLYEHIPLLGPVIKQLKKRVNQ